MKLNQTLNKSFLMSISGLLILFLTACGTQKEKLQFNLKKDAVYHQYMNSSSVVTQTMGEDKAVIDMLIACHLSYQVKEVTPEYYGMEVQYKSMNLLMKMDGMQIRFDSENIDTSDKVSMVMRNVINKAFYIKMLPNGTLKSIEGLDNIMSNQFEGLPPLSNEQKDQIQQYIEQSFGTQAFKGNIESMTQIFSSIEVGEGDHWKVNSNLHTAMNSYVETDFELKEMNDLTCKIVGKSKIKTDESSQKGSGELNMTYELSGDMESDIEIDRKTGWIKQANNVIDISGTVNMKGTPMMPEGMSLPMSLKTKMTMTDVPQ
jgi:hypothetical protein